MKRDIRKAVREEMRSAPWLPDPVRRDRFLESFAAEMAQKESRTSASGRDVFLFVLSQIAYMRKWIWGLSAAVFAAACFMAVSYAAEGRGAADRVLWGISALTPVLALTVIAESGRSQHYEMAELEMAARFSLRSVVLARLGVLGLENLLILAAFTVLSGSGGAGDAGRMYGALRTGICILLPYLLTSFIGLWIVCRVKGSEAVSVCIGVAACISVVIFFARDWLEQLYRSGNWLWWAAGTFALCMGVIKQGAVLVDRTEELI